MVTSILSYWSYVLPGESSKQQDLLYTELHAILTVGLLCRWIGNVAGVPEQFRWGIEEVDTMLKVEQANNLPNGTIG